MEVPLESKDTPVKKTIRPGKIKAASGYKPKYPVVLIPGFASSALEVWESPDEDWFRERVWVSISKLGQRFVTEQIKVTARTVRSVVGSVRNIVTSNNTTATATTTTTVTTELNETTTRKEKQFRERWLKHLTLKPDGCSDPEGIRVRPIEGLRAVDYLDTSAATKKRTQVFGKLICNLADLGYDTNNLLAAPYDWRIPPSLLQTRDNYFYKLKNMIKTLKKSNNNEKVVLVTHSMGWKVIHYFLWWIQSQNHRWIDDNIETVIAIAAPCLGAPKVLRCLISGDEKMGLDMFLSMEEMKTLSRSFGSCPWLFPVGNWFCNLREKDSKSFKKKEVKTLLELSGAEGSWRQYEQHYLHDKLYMQGEQFSSEEKQGLYTLDKPVERVTEENWAHVVGAYDFNNLSLDDLYQMPIGLKPPPTRNLTLIYGINLNTQVSFFFKESKIGSGSRIILDPEGDKLPVSNGLKVKNGIIYETKHTQQRLFANPADSQPRNASHNTNKHHHNHNHNTKGEQSEDQSSTTPKQQSSSSYHSSSSSSYYDSNSSPHHAAYHHQHYHDFVHRSGDGSVPYYSLNYINRFKRLQSNTDFEDSLLPQTDIVEIPEQEHRLILKNNTCIETVLDIVCGRKAKK